MSDSKYPIGRDSNGNTGDVRHPVDKPVVDETFVAQQDQETSGAVRQADPQQAATDPVAAARQEQVRADHDALQESERRVDASVSQEVRDRPVHSASDGPSEDATEAKRNSEAAHENAEAARRSADRNR